MAKAFPSLVASRLLRANGEVWQAYWPTVEEQCWLGQLGGFEVSREAWRRALQGCECRDDAVVAYAFECHQRLGHKAFRLFDDVLDLLAGAADAGMSIALVTNGPSDLQRDKVQALGLADSFAEVVISGKLGVAKPDPAPFLLAVERLDVDPQTVWHVGDSLSTDVAGHVLLGWWPCG